MLTCWWTGGVVVVVAAVVAGSYSEVWFGLRHPPSGLQPGSASSVLLSSWSANMAQTSLSETLLIAVAACAVADLSPTVVFNIIKSENDV